MSRPLSTDMRAAIANPKGKFQPIFLFQAWLADNSDVRYWTGRGNLTWNSQVWTGTGQLIAISAVEESVDLKAQDVTVTLNGVSVSMVSLFQQSLRNGKPGIVRIGGFDNATGAILTPKVWFRGRLNGATVDESNIEDPKGSLRYTDDLVGLRQASEWRFTHEQQQLLYPGDMFFQFLPVVQDRVIEFGRDW